MRLNPKGQKGLPQRPLFCTPRHIGGRKRSRSSPRPWHSSLSRSTHLCGDTEPERDRWRLENRYCRKNQKESRYRFRELNRILQRYPSIHRSHGRRESFHISCCTADSARSVHNGRASRICPHRLRSYAPAPHRTRFSRRVFPDVAELPFGSNPGNACHRLQAERTEHPSAAIDPTRIPTNPHLSERRAVKQQQVAEHNLSAAARKSLADQPCKPPYPRDLWD